jgi:hypothetical protein
LAPDADQQWQIAAGEDDVWRHLAHLAGQERTLEKMREAICFNRLARKFLSPAAATFRAYGRQDGLFHALHNLARVEIDAGEWADTERRLSRVYPAWSRLSKW